MNISKSSSDAEHWRDGRESLVDIPDILRLSVEAVVVYAGVVDTVLLSSSDTDLHLEPEVDLCHSGKVLGADLDVLFLALLREVKHVRAASVEDGEERQYCFR